MEEEIKLVDEGNGLNLYSYKLCTNDKDIEIKKNRGVIKNGEEIVSLSLPYTDEYVIDTIPSDLKERIDEYRIYPSIEGTLIRVFKYNDRLMITTNRKLDAFNSYWSSRLSYGQLFVNELMNIYKDENVIDTFAQHIDPERIYFFLLKTNNENRIVCIPKEGPNLYYIGYYNKDDQTRLLLDDENEYLKSISRIEELGISDYDSMIDYIRNVDPFQYQGVILFHKEKNEQIKILNDQYKYYWGIRNNNSNIYLRYLELRNDKLLEDFFKLYPKMIFVSDRFENNIFDISRIIYEAYVDRYIRKKYISLPKQEYVILKKAHEWHLADRQNNKIYRQKILSLLNDEKPYHLLQIIKRYSSQGDKQFNI